MIEPGHIFGGLDLARVLAERRTEHLFTFVGNRKRIVETAAVRPLQLARREVKVRPAPVIPTAADAAGRPRRLRVGLGRFRRIPRRPD